MNKVSKLAAIVGVGVLLPLSLLGKTVEQSYVDSYQGTGPEMPVPLAVVTPTLRAAAEGQVELTFVVNAQGVPTEIGIKSATDKALVAPAKDAISRWKFAPAKENGEPVARKVLLPMRFVVTD